MQSSKRQTWIFISDWSPPNSYLLVKCVYFVVYTLSLWSTPGSKTNLLTLLSLRYCEVLYLKYPQPDVSSTNVCVNKTLNLFAWFLNLVGTPTDAIWPGVSKLPDYKATFPKWPPQSLTTIVPTLGSDGIDLVTVMNMMILWSSSLRVFNW